MSHIYSLNENINNMSQDYDPQETNEWISSIHDVIHSSGINRAQYLIEKQIKFIQSYNKNLSFFTTPYLNTIQKEFQEIHPGNHEIESKIRSYTRWNAMAIVLRANKDSNLGGHIASFASAATLYDVGFNYFWHSPSNSHGGDLIFIQGHSSPGIYAHSFLLGRLNERHLDNFRMEVNGNGLSSYPHPWLMPNFWQFPTVSMGLGPIMAIYQAKFMKYLQSRNILKTEGRKVWAFIGDGETDEPESLGALGMASREKLDNLIFVINCNLQRLDGPVRGNGKIIQELESIFKGFGWDVIKVIWDSNWDKIFSKDKDGILTNRVMEIVDGEYQNYKSKSGKYIREHCFNSEKLQNLIKNWSDEDIGNLNYGGHDPNKIYAAFKLAIKSKDKPTLILVKTTKGYGMGSSGQAMNISHQQKKMSLSDLKNFRDKFNIPISDKEIINVPYIKFTEDSKEFKYMKERRENLGGNLPIRRKKSSSLLSIPDINYFDKLLNGTKNEHKISTTTAFTYILNILLKDKNIGKHIVPIVPDESRTFGMEELFRKIGIWSQDNQKYIPEDYDQLMFYNESKTGQILQEGINEAGGMSDWIAAATSYSTHDNIMIPFYIFYSMFGFQRIGDLAWAAGDMRSRGFLLGGTSGKTTLNGEGLQHGDGHSLLLASSIPNCISYDPTFGFELAIIIQNGLKRMIQEQEDIYYYITIMNENYNHPKIPRNPNTNSIAEDIIKGMYKFKKNECKCNIKSPKIYVQLLGSGAIFNEVIAASNLLKDDWGISSILWSVPSFTELARDGYDINRWNLLNPDKNRRISHVEKLLKETNGPIIAATDYVRAFANQISGIVPRKYFVLGTDGFGRSDTRETLRNFFEVNRYWITIASLNALLEDGKIELNILKKAINKYKLNCNKPNPMLI